MDGIISAILHLRHALESEGLDIDGLKIVVSPQSESAYIGYRIALENYATHVAQAYTKAEKHFNAPPGTVTIAGVTLEVNRRSRV